MLYLGILGRQAWLENEGPSTQCLEERYHCLYRIRCWLKEEHVYKPKQGTSWSGKTHESTAALLYDSYVLVRQKRRH